MLFVTIAVTEIVLSRRAGVTFRQPALGGTPGRP